MRLATFVKIWFGFDLALALFPPIHWSLNGLEPIAGVPASLAYVLAMSALAASSVVVIYLAERAAVGRAGA